MTYIGERRNGQQRVVGERPMEEKPEGDAMTSSLFPMESGLGQTSLPLLFLGSRLWFPLIKCLKC